MKRLESNTNRIYPIVLAKNFDLLVDSILALRKPSSILIITDHKVAAFYLEEVKALLESVAPVHTYVFEAGEKSKHLDTVKQAYNALINHQMDRSSLIIALGGGVVGDLAGFVASSYMRGVPFVQIPTTIVAQNDSSIGGKVGVDYLEHKNMVGAFYEPSLVYTNISTLLTLPKEQFVSGLSEVIKHALIKNKCFYDYLLVEKDRILQRDLEVLMEMSFQSASIKCEVVEADLKEGHLRKILNFGHTIGHALETVSEFALLHGECVAYGILMANFISYKRKELAKECLEEIEALLKAYELLKPLAYYDSESIYNQMMYDKKKAYGKISFILLKDIGQVDIVNDVTSEEIKSAIEYMKETCI